MYGGRKFPPVCRQRVSRALPGGRGTLPATNQPASVVILPEFPSAGDPMGSILTAFSRGIRRLGTPLFIAGTMFVLVIGVVAFALSRPRPATPFTSSNAAWTTPCRRAGGTWIQTGPGPEFGGGGWEEVV